MGTDFAAFDSCGVLAIGDGDPPESPSTWIAQHKPGFAQTFVVILLGYGEKRSGWRAWVCHRGRIEPIVSLQFMEDALFHLTTRPQDEATGSYIIANSRLRPVLRSAGPVAKRSRIMIVGLSGNGTPASIQLAPLVDSLVLVDFDKIEQHNLERIPIACKSDIGSNKAEVAGRHLARCYIDLGVFVCPKPFDHRETYPKNVDLIVTCVDERDEARLMAARFAKDRMIPHLDIGCGVSAIDEGGLSMSADIRFLLPTACIRCVGGLANLERAEYLVNAPRNAIYPIRRPPWRESRVGTSLTNNNTAVSIAVQTWIDYLNGEITTSVWHRLFWASGTSDRGRRQGSIVRCESAEVEAADYCPVCK